MTEEKADWWWLGGKERPLIGFEGGEVKRRGRIGREGMERRSRRDEGRGEKEAWKTREDVEELK